MQFISSKINFWSYCFLTILKQKTKFNKYFPSCPTSQLQWSHTDAALLQLSKSEDEKHIVISFAFTYMDKTNTSNYNFLFLDRNRI